MQEVHNANLQSSGRRQAASLFKKGQSGNPAGRKKGQANALTMSLREAVEIAARDCHPHGLAGWLVERAQGSVQDRQIFANMVGRVIPIQVNQQVQGGLVLQLGWLGGRAIGTPAAHAEVIDAQPVVAIEHSDQRHWTSTAEAQPEPVPAQPESTGK